MLVGMAVTIIGAFTLILHGLLDESGSMLCRQPLFLILRSGGELIVFFFLATGIALTRKIRSISRETIYEQTKQKQAQEKALRKLWIVIGTCVFNCTFQIIFDSVIFARGRKN
jgi:hypothetical protein